MKQSKAAATVKKTLRVWAVSPSGNITGVNSANTFWHVTLRRRTLSRKKRKKDVKMIVPSEQASVHK